MDGNERRSSVVEPMDPSARSGDSDHPPQQAASRGGSECDDGGGLHEGALVIEPPSAAFDLIGIWSFVQPPLPTHLVLEMLDRIGHEDVAAGNVGLRERLIENSPCRSDERLSGQVFLVSRLLSDQHQTRTGAALTWYDLGRELVQRTARAFGFGLAKRGQGRDPVRRTGIDLWLQLMHPWPA